MFRHPRYLEIPWEIRWDQRDSGQRRHLLLTVILTVIAMVLLGVGVISGLT